MSGGAEAPSRAVYAERHRCVIPGRRVRLAEAAGASSGSVTDIYLPGWFARTLPAIHVPLLVLIGWLHVGARRAGHQGRAR